MAEAMSDDLVAEAQRLVEAWDQRGSWTPDSPVGLAMRLAAEVTRLRAALAEAWDEGAKWGALQVAGLPGTDPGYVQIKGGANPYRAATADEQEASNGA